MFLTKHLPMFDIEPKSELRHICSLKSLKIQKYSADSDFKEVIESNLSGRVVSKSSVFLLEEG